MNDIVINISVPLDDENFLRRECPFCGREFKIEISKEDLTNLAQAKLDGFLAEENKDDIIEEDRLNNDEALNFCPYCGQEAHKSDWWTKEQLSYIRIFAENIMIDMVNTKLIRPLKNRYSGNKSDFFSFKIEAKEMRKKEPWISPEENDMKVFKLPCCQSSIKINDKWDKDIYCFYCGFQYSPNHN